MTDHEVLQQIKEDNPRVITHVYKKYHDEFIRFVQRGFPKFSKDSAEDAYSECLQALHRNIKNGRLVSLKCDLKTYLFQIGKYKVIDEINRISRTGTNLSIQYLPPEEILELDYFEEEDEKVKKNLLVSETIAKLTEPCKTILTLFWYEDKRDAEIVTMTNYSSTDTVKNQRSRCMKNLIKEVLSLAVNGKIISIEKRNQLLEK
jgi:RNA polymerase sigma-70 factor (ECF subfamily)